MRRISLVCLLLLAVAGPGAQPGLAQGGVPVDGVYAGGADLVGTATGRGSQGRCDQRIAFRLVVHNRMFSWRLPTSVATVAVAPDGTFSAPNGRRVINGGIQGTHFAARTTGPGCNYVWSLDRQ